MPNLRSAVNRFSMVPSADIPRSSFNRSHGYKTTFDAAKLVPFYVDEALPGDTFNLRSTMFGRLATPLHPFMDNLYLDTFFFAVPNRLIWDNWQKFNGEQVDPGDSTDFLMPTMTSPGGGYAENSLSDYFGLPTGVAGYSHVSLWHRAYNLIWNEWFRDQNLQDSVVVDRDDGPDDPADYVLLDRNKRHDYFTSALPWPQKGDAVPLPIGSTAPVVSTGVAPYIGSLSGTYQEKQLAITNGSDNLRVATAFSGGNTGLAIFSQNQPTGLEADLTSAAGSTVNAVRQAFQIQKLLERDARGGTRYTEIVRAHFGVTSPDARMQRPEYLGGGTTPINVNPVAQTSETGSSPQGNLAAFGTVTAHGHGFSHSFTEHCVVIGICCVRGDLNYQQGLNRMFSRSTRYDFYWPALAHIGEQAVESREIYLDGTANDDDVFGYQERYAEYRYKPSMVTGAMRSNAATPLDTWHLAQNFASRPVLGDTFIKENPPVDRVIAVPSEPHLLLDAWINLQCVRPMPMYGVPGLLDHF